MSSTIGGTPNGRPSVAVAENHAVGAVEEDQLCRSPGSIPNDRLDRCPVDAAVTGDLNRVPVTDQKCDVARERVDLSDIAPGGGIAGRVAGAGYG